MTNVLGLTCTCATTPQPDMWVRVIPEFLQVRRFDRARARLEQASLLQALTGSSSSTESAHAPLDPLPLGGGGGGKPEMRRKPSAVTPSASEEKGHHGDAPHDDGGGGGKGSNNGDSARRQRRGSEHDSDNDSSSSSVASHLRLQHGTSLQHSGSHSDDSRSERSNSHSRDDDLLGGASDLDDDDPDHPDPDEQSSLDELSATATAFAFELSGVPGPYFPLTDEPEEYYHGPASPIVAPPGSLPFELFAMALRRKLRLYQVRPPPVA